MSQEPVSNERLVELLASSAAAGVPNRIDLVREAERRWPVPFQKAGCKDDPARHHFVQLLAALLEQWSTGTPEQGRWGLNGKRGNVHELSDDSIAYRGAGIAIDRAHNNQPMEIIDVVAASCSPTAAPAWQPGLAGPGDVGAWVAPDVSVLEPGPGSLPKPTPPSAPPTPTKPPYPGDLVGFQIGEALFFDYGKHNTPPNPGMGVWFWRTAWDIANEGLSVDESITKHRAEWLAVLEGR